MPELPGAPQLMPEEHPTLSRLSLHTDAAALDM
jgi:hypothetical protein